MTRGQKPDQQWNAEDAGQRDGVRQVHRGHGQPAGKKEKTGSTQLSSTMGGGSNETSSLVRLQPSPCILKVFVTPNRFISEESASAGKQHIPGMILPCFRMTID
jgi:hypothetical protein